MFRGGFRSALEDLGNSFEILESDRGDAVASILAEHPDIDFVLLDLEMPGLGGAAALDQLRKEYPATAVVIVSAEQDPAVMRRVIETGASGFIPKSAKRPVLASALRLVLNGRIYVPAELITAPAESANDRRRRRVGELTDRQKEVLAFLARGLTNKEIGDVLGIALGTTKTHIAAILEALEATNRTEAATVLRDLELGADELVADLAKGGRLFTCAAPLCRAIRIDICTARLPRLANSTPMGMYQAQFNSRPLPSCEVEGPCVPLPRTSWEPEQCRSPDSRLPSSMSLPGWVCSFFSEDARRLHGAGSGCTKRVHQA
ncbi:MAG: response regulator transcription factor [Deltaproteobacteria bacterium]|nr:response regulator transcription factor [Deltaproteobacteria bacterium]